MFEQTVTLGPGTGTYSQHTLEILIMLLGALFLGIWFGWAAWAKYKQRADQLLLDNQSLNATLETLRADMVGLKSQLVTIDKESSNLSLKSSSLRSENSNLLHEISTLETELATTHQQNMKLDVALGLSLNVDAAHPHEFPLEVIVNVADHKALKDTTREIVLAENSPAPSSIEPTAFPIQTIELTPTTDAPDAEKGSHSIQADDLTLIDGIDSKTESLLQGHGINSFRQLSETTVETLKEILGSAGEETAKLDPGTWPSQANLAANDAMDTLKSVQGFLHNDSELL
jgi:predicted flap endonuclease-1-like 5' DNA nuclease